MEQQLVRLRSNLDTLKNNFSKLSDELCKGNKALQESLIPPSVELAQQIRICNKEFERLRNQVFQLAECLEVPKPATEEIISVIHLDNLLQSVIQQKTRGDEEVKLRALEILAQILRIRHSNDIDFIPLNRCQEQAHKLHDIVSNSPATELNSEAKTLASGQHPFAKLLRLITEKESLDYPCLEQLQTDVAQALGMSLALAALTGKLFLLQESDLSNTDSSETTILEASKIAEDAEKEHKPIVQKEISEPAKPTHEVIVKTPTKSQEITAAILEKNLEESPSALEDIIWQLIYEQKLSLAFQLACCWEETFSNIQPKLPSWIIRAVILGHYVRYEVGFGEIANILMDDFANFSENSFTQGEIEDNQAISLFLVASALRPALLAPNTNASNILQHLRLGQGLNRLFEYCQIIANYGCQHYPLNTTAIKKVRSQQEWEADITNLSKEVKAWMLQAPNFNLIFGITKAVWREWLKANNLISSLLTPIQNNDITQVEIVKTYLDDLASESQVMAKLDQTQKQLNVVNSRDKITGTSLSLLLQRVREAVDFGRRWLQLHESCLDNENDFSQRQAQQLKQELSSYHAPVLEELDYFAQRHSSVLVMGGISCCKKAVKDIQNLFDTNALLPSMEIELKYLLHADLLKIPALSLDEKWQPELGYKNLLTNGILELVADNVFDWRQAFERQIQSRNHEATLRIIEYLHAHTEDSIDIKELENTREENIIQCQDSLKRDINQTKNKIEHALSMGILKEGERANYAALIVKIEHVFETNLRFFEHHEKLKHIQNAINEKKQIAIENVRQRLNSLSLASGNCNYQRIDRLLDQGDVLTANEYIDMLERGDTIPEPELELDKFHDFFQNKIFQLEELMEKVSNRRVVIQKVKNRESFCDINLRTLPGSVTDRAAEMLRAWFTVKQSGKNSQPIIYQEDARIILSHLGFNPLQIIINQLGGRTWINVTTEVIRNKKICAVSAYGSAAKGEYRILCVWDRPTVDDILNTVGETSHGAPAFVFFFGRLTEPRRKELAKICRENRRTFVLIDDILMLYLCGAEEPRLPTLFDCALPFTFLEPYAATAGLVPPEMFYGRKQERDSIINPMGSCFIYGGRQLGKTALLRSVQQEFHSPTEGTVALWLDLKACGIAINRPIEDIWSELAKELKQSEVVPRSMPDNAGSQTLLTHVENWLNQNNNRRILLLLDEADKFLESDGTPSSKNNKVQGDFIQTSRLKGCMDKTERRFKVVFAGLHNVQRTTRLENHPLAHYGEPICIGPLLDNGEWREARALIKRPLASIGYKLSDDLVTRILSQTNYYPNLIQLYCQELLRHVNKNHLPKFDVKTTPPYQITDTQVDEAYQSQNLRKAIRDRFMWTLQLDQRYEVIAYSIAYESLTNPQAMIDGFSVSWVQDAVLTWWCEGFQGKSIDEIRALLEEMVGLGILRETNEARFALRSPNVVLLLGTEAEIEQQLLISREVPVQYNPETFRSALRDDLSRRSSLTVQQESALRRRENGVSIIFGSPAAGLEELKDFLVSAVGQEFFFSIDNVLEISNFTKRLQDLDHRQTQVDGTNIVLVSPNCAWNLDWIEQALKKVKQLKSKRSFVRVVFIADPKIAWDLINNNSSALNALIQERVSIFSLKPWDDAALRQWLEDCDFPAKDKESRKRISEVTANWHILLQRFYQQAKPKHNWEDNLQKLANSLTNSDILSELADSIGLNICSAQPTKVLKNLSTLEEASSEDLISIIEGVSADIVNQTLKWAELLRIAYPVGNDYWRVDPLVSRILASYGE